MIPLNYDKTVLEKLSEVAILDDIFGRQVSIYNHNVCSLV